MPRLNPFASGRAKLSKLWESRIDGHVVSLAWSAQLGYIAAASADGPISLFDAKTGEHCHTLAGHGFGTSCLDFSVDGKYLASAGQDGKVRIWEPWSAVQLHELPGGAAWVDRVAWCPTENTLASAAGKKLRLWNLDGVMIQEYLDHPSTITDIQWKPNEAILASTAYGKLFLWSPAQQNAVREFSWQGSMLALAWSPNGQYVAAGAQDCSVHFWLLKTGEDLQMSGYPRKVRELAWDTKSRYLATGGAETSCVWDCSGVGPAGTQPSQLEAHTLPITALAYQSRGVLLASGGEDGLVALWRPGQQQGALALARHVAPVSQLVWSADDQRLGVGTADGAVCLYAV